MYEFSQTPGALKIFIRAFGQSTRRYRNVTLLGVLHVQTEV